MEPFYPFDIAPALSTKKQWRKEDSEAISKCREADAWSERGELISAPARKADPKEFNSMPPDVQLALDEQAYVNQAVADAMSRKVKSDGGSSDYYSIPIGAKDLQDLIEYKRMEFGMANIFKACYRWGEKSGTDKLYDINKIIWFAHREKARLVGAGK